MKLDDIGRATCPEEIFTPPDKSTPNEDYVQKTFHELVKICHPDVVSSDDARYAFIHLKRLRDTALMQISKGKWELPGLLKLESKNGRRFEARYKRKTPFELGDMYIGERTVLLILDKEHVDLFARGEKNISRYPKYADDEMRKQFSTQCIPQVTEQLQLVDGRLLMAIRKQPDVYSLRDILNYFGGKLDPKHVGWVVSRLLNISCWFSYCEVAHYGLCVDNLFVAPKHHSIHIMSGWWYAYRNKQKLIAAPRIVVDNVEQSLYRDKTANLRINQSLARLVGRELLGDVTGAHVKWAKDIPEPMRKFLLHPASEDPVDDYGLWRNEVLKQSFGPPKFIPMEVSPEQLYGA
jgi:hypothetical protein